MLNRIKDPIHANNIVASYKGGFFFLNMVKFVFCTSVIYQFYSVNISQESNQTKKKFKKINLKKVTCPQLPIYEHFPNTYVQMCN